MFIRSERLFLRPAWPEDAHELHGAIAHEAVVRNLARVPWPYAIEDARAFAAQAPDRRFPSLLVTMPGARGSRIIGGVGLHEGEAGADLGYWITPDAWGRGFATEASSAMLRLARTLGHRQIGAHHFMDNPASGHVLEKVGFRSTGALTQRSSRSRGGTAAARSYCLRLDGSGDCEREMASEDACSWHMRAA